MAERDLVVRIIGDEKDLLRAYRNSERGTRQFQAQMTGVSRSLRNVFAAAGVALGATAIIGALRSTVNAAIDFESSFAGVRKTVDATEPQLQALALGFRALAREIPVSVEELNRIGEAAGQLGIQRKGILDFTETVAALGVTTNLASEQAADAMARLANITQIPQDQFDNLGSTVVDLGNKLAATESEIVDFGLRIAAAGKIVGLTVDQTLAIAGAFSSVGIEAEAGGTAVSKVFISLANAVETGGKQLQTFADTAGTSIAEFRRLFEADTAGAFTAFVQGLKRVDAEGGNVFQTLRDLGLSDVRLIRAFLSISQSGDLLTRSLATGSRAWEQNSALQVEAAKRYETTASQLQIFQNRVNDLQITLGNVLAPALLEIITPLGEWLEQTKNQERVQKALIDTMEDARAIFDGVRAVVVPLAEAVKSLADKMGGLANAVELALVAMVAAKVVGFGTAITGLGTSALATTGRVNALRFALLRLGAIGVIALSIEFLINYDELQSKAADINKRIGKALGLTQTVDLEPKLRLERLQGQLRQVNTLLGADSDRAKELRAEIEKVLRLLGRAGHESERGKGSAGAGRGPTDTGEKGRVKAVVADAEAEAKRAALNFKKLLQRLDLELERALGTTTLSDDISALRKIEAAIVAQIAQEGKTFKRSKELIETRNKISQALSAQADQTNEAFLAALNLNLDRARATTSLQDDLKALQAIENALKDRIRVEGRTTDLLGQLAQVKQDQLAATRQIREQAAERRVGRQFGALGLTAEGDERVPGAGALRKRLGDLREQLKGTTLDTDKTRSQLAGIAKVLSGAFGKAGRDVRSAILGMLNDISSALEGGAAKQGPLTKTSGLNTKKILEGLGLSPEEIRELRGRLSSFNTAGRAPAGSQNRPTGGGFVGGGIVVENNVTVSIDGQKFSAVVTKQQQKTKRRNPKQKRGPNRIGGV